MTGIKFSAADVGKVQRILANDNHEHRLQMLDFAAKDPIYIPRYDISLEAKRELALQRLRRLAHEGFISVMDFEKNPLRVFAAHEIAGMIDGSMGTKMTGNDITCLIERLDEDVDVSPSMHPRGSMNMRN